MAISRFRKINKSKATTGLRAAIRILETWGATQEQGASILRVPYNTYNHGKQSEPNWEANVDTDQLTRISLVLNIHAALRTIFENPENQYGFMTMSNQNVWFNGRTPLEAISCGELPEIYEVFKRIDSLREPQ